MNQDNDVISKLARVEAAARCLIYVFDRLPGDDLGASAMALVKLELRAALKELGGEEFDAAAALAQLQAEDKQGERQLPRVMMPRK
jgi:hypothetical protein